MHVEMHACTRAWDPASVCMFVRTYLRAVCMYACTHERMEGWMEVNAQSTHSRYRQSQTKGSLCNRAIQTSVFRGSTDAVLGQWHHASRDDRWPPAESQLRGLTARERSNFAAWWGFQDRVI